MVLLPHEIRARGLHAVEEYQTVTLPPSDATPNITSGSSLGPHLFLVMAGHRPLFEPSRHRLGNLQAVIIGRGERQVARSVMDGKRQLYLSVPDPWMSSSHAQLVKALGRWMVQDLQSRNGTLLNGMAVQQAVLNDGDVIECGHTFFIFRTALETAAEEPPDVSATFGGAPEVIGLSTLCPALERDFTTLRQIATSRVSVVILGESGTGKELIARAVHHLSKRAGPFVGVNCGALPQTLLESELFGHRKGAFSGAVDDHPGLIRSADRGTLLLDEIGDLPLGAQAAFLRVLQECQVLPVGGTRPLAVDFRLCAATHRNLDQLVEEKMFREDLLARISGFTLRLLPLRERREDLGLIIGRILDRMVGERAGSMNLTKDAVRAMLRYDWPLNIRELQKCMERAVVLAGEGPIKLEHLPATLNAPPSRRPPGASTLLERTTEGELVDAEDRERYEQLVALLTEHKGNVSALARTLGKDRVQIRRWLRRYGLDPAMFRSGDEAVK
jgi:DNA-binding NtrC family response regulator